MPNIKGNRLVTVLYAKTASIVKKNDNILSYFNKILSKIVKQYNGKKIDESFILFSVPTLATYCAIDIQKAIKKWNLHFTKKENILVSIVLDIDKVLNNNISKESKNRIYNVSELAQYGDIISSNIIYSSIRSEKEIYTKDLGRILINNNSYPSRYYKIYIHEIYKKLDIHSNIQELLINSNVHFVDRDIKGKNEIIVQLLPFTSENENNSLLVNKVYSAISKELEKISIIRLINTDKNENKYFIIDGNISFTEDQSFIDLKIQNNEHDILWSKSQQISDRDHKNINRIIGEILQYFNIPIPLEICSAFTYKLSNDKTALRFYNQAISTLESGDNDKIKISISILKNALERDNEFIEARCTLAIAYLRMNKLDDSFYTLKEAEDISMNKSNQYGIALTKLFFAYYLNYLNNHEQAKVEINKANKLLDSIGERASSINADIIKVTDLNKKNDKMKLLQFITEGNPQSIENKDLVVIMFTELVNYSKYDNKEEILSNHDIKMKMIINRNNGKIIKHMSEKILVIFNITDNAVSCANGIHSYWNEFDNDIKIRIGMHIGEITIKGGDIFGDSVNMAARIESIALPKTTVISQVLFYSLSNINKISYIENRPVILKNIEDPERTYFIYNSDEKIFSYKQEDINELLKKQGVQFFINEEEKIKESLAILYIDNLGKQKDEYIAYNFTEELITKLQKPNILYVPNINEIIRYKDSNLDTIKIANNLKVENIILGSIINNNGRLNFELNLINVKLGKSLWTDKFDIHISGQDAQIYEIIQKIFNILNIEIPSNLFTRFDKPLTKNPDAYENYLKGNYIFETGKNSEELNKGKELLKEAFKIDNNFVEARYTYAMIEQKLGNNNLAIDILNESLIIAKDNNNSAGIASIHNGFGLIYLMTTRFNEAIMSFEKALHIRIQLSDLHDQARICNNLGQCYSNTMQPEKAERQHIRALEINKEVGDDNGIGITYLNLLVLYNMNLQYDKCIELGFDSLKYFDNSSNLFAKGRLLHNLGTALVLIGRYEEGYDILTQSIDIALEFNDDIVIAMSEYYLGIIRYNQNRCGLADKHFRKCDEYCNKSNYLSGKIMLPIEYGLNDFKRGKFNSALRRIDKTGKLASNLNEKEYLNMSRAASYMVRSMLDDISVHEIDTLSNKLSKIDHIITMRTAWYISQAYLYINEINKAKKYQIISRKMIINISSTFNDSVKEDFLTKIELHQMINSNLDQKRPVFYRYCFQCGLRNTDILSRCISCDTKLKIQE